MEIAELNSNEVPDFRDLIGIFKEVFENEEPISDDGHLRTLLSHADFKVFVIRKNNKVVGGLTMYILHRYYAAKPVAYIYDVGVSPVFQGKGLGKALMEEVCRYCKDNGFEEAYVEAERDDLDAVNFYRRTKFTREMNAIHFTYTFEE
jgi:aminoglycoside 3-N-acetyltransferase I